jgi:CDP-diacylglycerol pyrophosphatase
LPAGGTAADRRDVLVKDAHGDYQFLLMPLDKVSGIESHGLYQRGVPNYFAAAWQARGHTEQALGRPLPRSGQPGTEFAARSLAAPAAYPCRLPARGCAAGTGCTCRCARSALVTVSGAARHQYQAYLLPGAELTANPLNLLAYGLSGVGDVGQWSLVVAGRGEVQGGPGFILLATRVDAASGNDASGEELQDHACTVDRCRCGTGAGALADRLLAAAPGRCSASS